MQNNYNPLQDAMGILQVLGQRKAQNQQFELGQGHLDNQTQQIALEQQRLAQQGDQFDRGFGLDQQQFEQRGGQFDRQQALAEHVQQLLEQQNQQMNPLQQEHMQLQNQGLAIQNQLAPLGPTMDQQRFQESQAHAQAMQKEAMISNLIQMMAHGPQQVGPRTPENPQGSYGPNPDLVQHIMNQLNVPHAQLQPPPNLAPFAPPPQR